MVLCSIKVNNTILYHSHRFYQLDVIVYKLYFTRDSPFGCITYDDVRSMTSAGESRRDICLLHSLLSPCHPANTLFFGYMCWIQLSTYILYSIILYYTVYTITVLHRNKIHVSIHISNKTFLALI